MIHKKARLDDLGYSNFFEKTRKLSANTNFIPARVIAEHKETYILKNEISEFSAKITGKMRFSASSKTEYPAVGDWVLISIDNKDHATIQTILPRKSALKRKSSGKSDIQLIASNIDTVFVIQSIDRDYNLNRFERYFSLADSGKINPAIILNKIDLISESELELKLSEIKDRFNNIDIFATSVINNKGLIKLTEYLKKTRTYCFLGSSGVGKTSILNKLIGKDTLKTGEISTYTNRGKHITTHRELYILDNGAMIIDNPGMREIGLIDSDTDMKNIFAEISKFAVKCKFSNCTHIHEPECKILEAVISGKLDKNKYENFIKLAKENENNNMLKFDKKDKDRRIGKMYKRDMKHKKNKLF